MRFFLFTTIIFLLNLPVKAQEHDAELVNQETTISIKGGKLAKTILYEIKINNRSGEGFTNITIPYSSIIKVSNIKAYIKNAHNETIKTIGNKDIKHRSTISDYSFYEDEFEYFFTLKHNVYPYTIVYSYQVKLDEFLHITNWMPVIHPKIPTHSAQLTLDVPVDYKFAYKNSFIDEFTIDSTQTSLNLKWKASYKKLFNQESFSPPINQFLPSVVIIPEKFKYSKPGSFENWKAYGNWQFNINSNLMDLPAHDKTRINGLIKGIDNDIDKIKRLYNALQAETRYINISIETGGMKPYPASYVAVNRYGDCKALTNYFKSVLHHIGIQSFYTNVYAGDKIRETDMNFPSQQFNHVILCVPLSNDTLWLDCTSKLPFGYVGTFNQNRDVLMVDDNNSHFLRTPALSVNDVKESRTVNIVRNNEREAIADFANTYKGDRFESLYYLTNHYSEQRKQHELIKNYIEPGFELIQMKPIESWRDSSYVRLTYQAKSAKIFNQYGHEMLIKILPFELPELTNAKDRNLPVQIDYPILKTDSLIYTIPDGRYLSKQLTNQVIESKFGTYQINFSQNDTIVTVNKSVVIYSGKYSKDDYQALFDFIRKIKEYENSAYLITHKNL